jgi:four helix bundle protein
MHSHSHQGLRKGGDIARRLHWLGAAILSLARELPSGVEMRHVSNQLVRAGTSCGANYEEARVAQSRADFIHKISFAAKEARETMYWLELLREYLSDTDRAALAKSQLDVRTIVDEARQLTAILGASVRTAKSNAKS